MDDFDDDDYLADFNMEQYKQSKLLIQPTAYKSLTECTDFKRALASFPKVDAFSLYVHKGNEINAELRSIEAKKKEEKKKKENPEKILELPVKDTNNYSEVIANISKNMKKMGDVFPGCDFIVTCRTMSNPYDPEMIQGFMSTSNKVVRMSNLYLYTILIPHDVNIGMIDISSQTGTPNTYEIIIDRNVPLLHLFDTVYVVSSKYSIEHLSRFEKAAKEVKRCSFGHGSFKNT
jgi:hypothetical protein